MSRQDYFAHVISFIRSHQADFGDPSLGEALDIANDIAQVLYNHGVKRENVESFVLGLVASGYFNEEVEVGDVSIRRVRAYYSKSRKEYISIVEMHPIHLFNVIKKYFSDPEYQQHLPGLCLALAEKLAVDNG